MATLLLVAAASSATAGAGALAVGVAVSAASVVGSFIDNKFLFPAGKPPTQTGNRIKELNAMTANEGEFIYFCAGPRCRVPGQVIWLGALKERDELTVTKIGGGLKGTKAKSIDYFYFNSMAIAIAEGEINEITKIFANGKIIFDGLGGASIGAGLSGFVDTFETLDNFSFKSSGDYFGLRQFPYFDDEIAIPVSKTNVADPNAAKLVSGSVNFVRTLSGINKGTGAVALRNKIDGNVITNRITGLQDKSLRFQIKVVSSAYRSETIQLTNVEISDRFINRRSTADLTKLVRSEHTFFGIRVIGSNSSVELRMNNNKDGKILSRRVTRFFGKYARSVNYTYEQIGGTYIVFDGDEDNPVYVPGVIKSSCRLKIEIENNVVKCFIDSTEVASNPWVNGTVQKLGYFTDVPAISEIPSAQSGGNEDTVQALFDDFILQVPVGGGQEVAEGLEDIRYNSITLYSGDFNQLPDSVIESEVVVQQSKAGILGRFYNNRNFSNQVGSSIDDVFDYRWSGSKPIPEIDDPTNFSIDWDLIFVPTESSPNYRFEIGADDYFFFSITDDNGHQILMKTTEAAHSFDGYKTFANDGGAHNHGGDGVINSLSFTKGKKYPMKVQYANYQGNSKFFIRYRLSSTDPLVTLSKAEIVLTGSDDCVFTPTFRGTSYLTLELLALYDFSNNIPQLSILFGADESLNVAELITKVLLRAGLTEDDINVDDIPDIEVNGFMVSGSTSTIDLINSIMVYANLNVQQSGELIRFFLNGNETNHIVDADFLAARSGSGGGFEPALTITEIDNHGLPNEVVITFYDLDRDLQPGSVQIRRLPVFTESVQKIEMPFAMTREQALIIAERMLWGYWSDIRMANFKLPEDFFFIGQGDSVTLNYKGFTHVIKIINATYGHNGVIDYSGVIQEIEINRQFATGNNGAGTSPERIVYVPGDLNTLILNLPPIFGNNVDLSDAGYFFAAALLDDTKIWKGASITESEDDSTFLDSQIIPIEAFSGTTLDVLPDGTVDVIDESSTVDISMFNGALGTITTEQLLNGLNIAVVGEEIIGFRDAEELNPGQFRLSGLLRGLRDTVDHTSTHVLGERFILIDTDIIQFAALTNVVINQPRFWKGLSLGQTDSDVSSFQQNITGENLVPFRPVTIDGTRDGSDNLTITWDRQDRASFPLLVIPPPLSEQSLEFEIDFLDGATVVRTKTVTAETASYTAAEQTTDGLTPGDPVDVRIYQMSVIVGRGNEGSATV